VGGLVAVVSMEKMARLMIRTLALLTLLLQGVPLHAQEVTVPPAELPISREKATTGAWWHQDIWLDPNRGFYWYPPDHPPKKEEIKEAKEPEKKKSIFEMTTGEEVNKELKRLLDVAIFNPTETNVYDYQKAKAWTLEKAAIFTDVGRRITWQNADIDYNAKVPLATFGRHAMTDAETRDKRLTMADLSKSHGILFFYRSDCPYCHQQAPILAEIRKRHGIDVLAVSLDGGPIPEFPDAKPDNGISYRITEGAGIQTVPATYLVSNDTKNIVPIGSGLLSMEEVVQRVYTLTQTSAGDRF